MPISSALGSSALLPGGLGLRNKFINGDMRISQRGTSPLSNAAAVNTYGTDRWHVYGASASRMTIGQSTTAPTDQGFPYSSVVTSSAATTAGSTDYYGFRQYIEGFNTADLAWGTANAKPAVLSFWVRSSIAGTYSIAIHNTAATRSYIATYTVISPNAWERKIVTIPGETTGVWPTDSQIGVAVWFDLGSGSGRNGSALTWNTGLSTRTSDSTNWIATNGATFYITGAQFEQNYQVTPFEHRNMAAELSLALRYFHVVPVNSMWAYNLYWNVGLSGGSQAINYRWPTPMRAVPTIRTAGGSATALDFTYYQNGAGAGVQKFLADTSGSSVYACSTLLYSSDNNSNTLLTANGYTMGQNQIPLWVSAEL